MAQTLGVTCDVIEKFVRVQKKIGFSLLCHFALELSWSLEFKKVGAKIGSNFWGFGVGGLSAQIRWFLNMNWRVFEKKKLGLNWGRLF